MRLLSLELKNFRSYGEKNAGKKIIFRNGINLIVGENNVGKSNLLRALEFLEKKTTLDSTDCYSGDTEEKEVSLELNVKLTGRDLQEFIEVVTERRTYANSRQLEKLTNSFGEVHFLFSSKGNHQIRIGSLFILKNHAKLTTDFATSKQYDIPWKQVLESYFSVPDSSIFTVVRNEAENNSKSEDIRIVFQENIMEYLSNLLNQKLKIFSEVRQRPSGRNEKVLESYDGGLVADVLANLKMGNRQQRRSFELIKSEFNKLFPNLQMEVTKATPETPPRIVIEKIPIEYEVSVDRVGAGIGEMIILLTHLIATREMIFGLDMPELHFHPHAQRLLLEILRERSQDNQILVVTHSPILLDPKEIEKIIVIREQKGQTTFTQLDEGYLSTEEKTRVERHLNTYNREFFFSRATLAVEGPTELGAMPIFAKALGKNFDTFGVSIIEAGGKHFDIFLKLFRGLKFPFLIMSDKDALMNIEESIEINKRKVRTSPVFYNLAKIGLLRRKHRMLIHKIEDQVVTIKKGSHGKGKKEAYDAKLFSELRDSAKEYGIVVLSSNFEGVLENSGYGKLIRDAEALSWSKVTRGRFVAQEIVEQKGEIPEEIANAINIITTKTTQG